jgi:hypothetical protein
MRVRLNCHSRPGHTADQAMPRLPLQLFKSLLPGLTDKYLVTAEEVPRRMPADPCSLLAASP